MREPERSDRPESAAKRVWRKPELRVYGDVGDLTANAGTAGNFADGGMTYFGTVDLKST